MSNQEQRRSAVDRFLFILLPYVIPLLLIILGVMLLTVSADIINRIFLVLGILVALFGFAEITIFFSRRKYEVQAHYLISGIALFVLGLLLIILPFTINTLIPIIIGVVVLMDGVSGIYNTFHLRRENSSVLVPLIIGILNLATGVWIIAYVLTKNDFGWVLIGILMICSGVLRIINEIAVRFVFPRDASMQTINVTSTSSEPPLPNAPYTPDFNNQDTGDFTK